MSVLLTVYKRTDLIPLALQSVLDQTFQDFEIVVADDSGEESSLPVCEPHLNSGRLIYQGNETTLGIVESLKRAIRSSKGTYLAVLNDDDLWEPYFLERLVAALDDDPRRVLAFSNHWIIDENGVIDEQETETIRRKYRRDRLAEGEVSNIAEFALLHWGIPLAMASVFRKDSLNWDDELSSEVTGAYDYWIACLLAAKNQPIYFVPENLTRYRVHGRMETARVRPDKTENHIYMYSQFLERNMFENLRSKLIQQLSLMEYLLGRDQLTFNHRTAARQNFKKAFKTLPSLKYIFALILSYAPEAALKKMKWMSPTT